MADPSSASRQPDGLPIPDCERLWSAREVADFLGVPVTTLHQWRYLGAGPDAFRVGKHLRYDPTVVRRWLVEQCGSARGA